MKKLIAIILALVMVLSLAACGAPADGGEEAVGGGNAEFVAGEATKVNKDELPHYKFAFSYANFSDKLGSQFKACMEYLGEAYNVEFVFFEAGSGDERITNIESVLAAGDVDGVITVGGTPACVAVAEKYNVPYVMTCGFPSLEEEIKGVAQYDNFLGGVVDDDVWAGEHCIQALYDAGARKFCYSGLTQGLAKSHDDRANAMRRFVEANPDMELMADSYTMAEWHTDVASFNAAFPDLDGICFSAMTDAVYQAMETEGLTDGSVKISAVDISSQTGEYFKNGVQVWTCGGQYGTAMMAFAVLYNYVSDGTRIIEDTSKPMIRPYLEITSYEEYEQYVKYVECPLPVYDADEISEYIHIFNPDVTYDTFMAAANAYTLQDVIARHGAAVDAMNNG